MLLWPSLLTILVTNILFDNLAAKCSCAGLFPYKIHAARANVPADFLHRSHRKFMALPSPSGDVGLTASLYSIMYQTHFQTSHQLLAAFVVSFVAVMAIVGTDERLTISLGTPGLVKKVILKHLVNNLA